MQIKLNLPQESPPEKEEPKIKVDTSAERFEQVMRKDFDAEPFEEPKKKKKEKEGKRILNPNPKTNEDYYRNYQKRVRNNRVKKIGIYSTIIGFLALIVILNFYFIFFREITPIETIAAQVKTINKINNYPKESVQGYLQANAKELISTCVDLSNGSGAKNFTISNVEINKISVKSDNNANVYFSCNINTNIGTAKHNFLIPLYYENTDSSFHPSGDLIVCAAQNLSDTQEIEASLWSFEKIKKFDKDQTEKLTSFVNNFLEILYNNPGNDLTTFYTGDDVFGDYNCTYLGIQECNYYQESNAMGLNCEVYYTVKSNEGVVFSVHNYLAIKNNNGKFEIIHFY